MQRSQDKNDLSGSVNSILIDAVEKDVRVMKGVVAGFHEKFCLVLFNSYCVK